MIDYESYRLFHSGDPDTSRKAAEEQRHRISQRERILAVFRAEPHGLTADAASRLAGYSPQEGSGRRRVSDLLSLGLIEDTGVRLLGEKGRSVRVLRAVNR